MGMPCAYRKKIKYLTRRFQTQHHTSTTGQQDCWQSAPRLVIFDPKDVSDSRTRQCRHTHAHTHSQTHFLQARNTHLCTYKTLCHTLCTDVPNNTQPSLKLLMNVPPAPPRLELFNLRYPLSYYCSVHCGGSNISCACGTAATVIAQTRMCTCRHSLAHVRPFQSSKSTCIQHTLNFPLQR